MLLTNYKTEIATTLPGGERHLIEKVMAAARVEGYITDDTLQFNWRITSSNDLIDLMLMDDKISRQRVFKSKILVLYYFPYARADRASAGNGALGVKVMANLINNMNFTKVVVLEPHSDVTAAVINNVTVVNYNYVPSINACKGTSSRAYVIAPDLGAIKRAQNAANSANVPLIRFDKKRERGTGKILSIACLDNLSTIVDEETTPYFVIVDDIVDGGATFTPIALYLKNNYPTSKVILSVPHAILSKSTDEQIKKYGHGLVGIDELNCTNSIRDLVGHNISQENLFLY